MPAAKQHLDEECYNILQHVRSLQKCNAHVDHIFALNFGAYWVIGHNARGEMYRWEGVYAFYESNVMMRDRQSPPGGERGGMWSLDSLIAARMGKGLRNGVVDRSRMSQARTLRGDRACSCRRTLIP